MSGLQTVQKSVGEDIKRKIGVELVGSEIGLSQDSELVLLYLKRFKGSRRYLEELKDPEFREASPEKHAYFNEVAPMVSDEGYLRKDEKKKERERGLVYVSQPGDLRPSCRSEIKGKDPEFLDKRNYFADGMLSSLIRIGGSVKDPETRKKAVEEAKLIVASTSDKVSWSSLAPMLYKEGGKYPTESRFSEALDETGTKCTVSEMELRKGLQKLNDSFKNFRDVIGRYRDIAGAEDPILLGYWKDVGNKLNEVRRAFYPQKEDTIDFDSVFSNEAREIAVDGVRRKRLLGVGSIIGGVSLEDSKGKKRVLKPLDEVMKGLLL